MRARLGGRTSKKTYRGPSTPMRYLAIALLLVALVTSLEPVINVFEWTPLVRVTVAAMALAIPLAWASARARLTPAATSAVLVTGYLVGGLLVVGMPWRPNVSWGQAIRALVGGAITSWKDALTLSPPLGDIPGLIVIPWLVGYVGTAVILLLALGAGRFAVWAGAVPLVSLAMALILTGSNPQFPAIAGAAIAVLCLTAGGALRGTLQIRRPVALATLIGVALAGGIALPTLAPPPDRLLVRELVAPPFNPRDYESPLATYRAFLKADEVSMFTITGGPTAFPIRLAAMDSYDGVVWTTTVSSEDGGTGGTDSGQFRRVPGALPVEVSGTEHTLDITIMELPGVWLPSVGAAREFYLPDPSAWDGLRYNVATSTGVFLPGMQPELAYSLRTVVPQLPEDAELAGVPVADVALGSVSHSPDIVEVLAREWAGTAGSPIEIARALELRFSAGGWYSDGLADQSPAGHGADRMTALLEAEQMIGNAEQYASAMALMARALGLPARVVLGFNPIERSDADSEIEAGSTTRVAAADATAWVEIPFEGYGWVPFFPTPDRDRTPDLAPNVTVPQAQPQVVQPQPTQAPATDIPTLQPSDVRAPDQDQAEEPASVMTALVIVGAVSAVLLLLLAPFLMIMATKAWRRRRRRQAEEPRIAAQGAWAELVAVLHDTGDPPGWATSRVEVAATLDSSQVNRLAALADAAQFGPAAPTAVSVEQAWQDADQARSGLLGDLSKWQRWRARLSTKSLRRRTRQ